MESSKEELLKEAALLHGKIAPTGTRKSFEECFTTEDSKLILWFNDENGNTKVIVKEQTQEP